MIVDWLLGMASSLESKRQEVFAHDVIWSVPIYDRSNAQCRLVEVLHAVVQTKVGVAMQTEVPFLN